MSGGNRSTSTVLAELLREFELTKATVLRMATSTDQGEVPGPEDVEVVNDPEERIVELLGEVRRSMLAHPATARAIVAFLAAEGRRFLDTEDGRRTYAGMVSSPEVETLRTVWEKVTLNLLDDESDDGPIPEAWVELVRDLAVGSGLDRLADRLRPDGLA